jgi:hypothetical protein
MRTSARLLLVVEAVLTGLTATDRSIAVRDLDGDGELEVLLDLYSGGAYCCTWTRVYRYNPATRHYPVGMHFGGDPAHRLEDLNHDGKPELVTADDRFAYWFTAYAFSGMPIQIWSYARGAFTNVTDRFRAQIAADAARQWRAYRSAGRRYGEYRGFFAAWAADEYRLGHPGSVRRALARERGHLAAGAPDGISAYTRSLERFLRAAGYLR